MITKEQVVKRIKRQIEGCKEIDSDWMSLTVGTGKRILELLEEQDEQEEKKIKMMRYIADLQLSIGGLMDPMTDYEQGQYDGLQMIFDLLAENK